MSSANPKFRSMPPSAVRADGERQFVDVRKPEAVSASGLTIEGAVWRHPFDALNWASEFAGCRIAIFCVHGHEVSQAVGGYLAGMGVDVALIEGGFEGWREAGLPVVATGDADE